MKILCVWTATVLSLLACSFAQSSHVHVLNRSVIQEQSSPLELFATRHGSSAILKNVSNKQIASFVFVCLVRKGKTYNAVDTYDASEGSIDPGTFSQEGGFDATPLNACRSWKGVLAVASVKFSDGSSWESPLLKSVHTASSKVNAQQLQRALSRLQMSPNNPTVQLDYIHLFPHRYSNFLELFDLDHPLYDGHEFVEALSSLESHASEVGSVLIQLSQDAVYEGDAPSYLQQATAAFAEHHTRKFVSSLKQLPANKQVHLITFLADVENFDAYSEYQLTIDHLIALGEGPTARRFELARAKRSKQPHN